jgi:hypothetical protein
LKTRCLKVFSLLFQNLCLFLSSCCSNSLLRYAPEFPERSNFTSSVYWIVFPIPPSLSTPTAQTPRFISWNLHEILWFIYPNRLWSEWQGDFPEIQYWSRPNWRFSFSSNFFDPIMLSSQKVERVKILPKTILF